MQRLAQVSKQLSWRSKQNLNLFSLFNCGSRKTDPKTYREHVPGVVAYFALASGVVNVAAGPARFRGNMPDPIPVVVLARLAVERAYQGQGLGRAMVRDAARRVVHAADTIGIRGIIVHAISDDAEAFYLKLGFEAHRLSR